MDKQKEKRDSQEGRQEERLINTGKPQDSRKTSEVAAWDMEGVRNFHGSPALPKAPDPQKRQGGGRAAGPDGSGRLGYLSRNQSTRAGQMPGEEGSPPSWSKVKLSPRQPGTPTVTVSHLLRD